MASTVIDISGLFDWPTGASGRGVQSTDAHGSVDRRSYKNMALQYDEGVERQLGDQANAGAIRRGERAVLKPNR